METGESLHVGPPVVLMQRPVGLVGERLITHVVHQKRWHYFRLPPPGGVEVLCCHSGAGDAGWLPAVVFVFIIQSKHVRDCLLIALLNKSVCTSCAAVHRSVCSL